MINNNAQKLLSIVWKGGLTTMTKGGVIGIIAMGLGMIGSIVGSVADNKKMEETVEKKVNEALEKRDEEES